MSGFADIVEAGAEALLEENLRLGAGNTWSVGWTVLDSANQPVDFSDCTASLVIKDRKTDATLASWTNTLTEGRVIALSSVGRVDFKATAAATAQLATITDYYGKYQLKITKGSDTITLVYGTIFIKKAL